MKVFAAGMLLSVVTAHPFDWPQWRGPDRDAVSKATSRSGVWPAALTARWRSPVGAGQSSPVVSGSTVFVFSREEDVEVARALDLHTGTVRWRRTYPAPYRVYPGASSYGKGPRSTPVVHEGRLFTLGISGILTGFDATDGRILWQKDFAGRFPAASPPFGTSMSPLIVGGRLIAHAGGHEGGALIAFDPKSGEEKWVIEGDGPSYSSPIVASFSGREHVVIQVHRKVLGVDPASGRLLWSLPFVTPCDQNIVTPLLWRDLVIVSSLDQGTLAIRITPKGAQWAPEVAWHTPDVSMYMSTPILVNGKVLGLSHRKRGQYFALDPATGAVIWKSEGGQGANAAFVLAQGALLVLQGDGTLLRLPEDASGFAPVNRYRVSESETFAHPVPTEIGILVKDENGLALFGRGTTPAAREATSSPPPGR